MDAFARTLEATVETRPSPFRNGVMRSRHDTGHTGFDGAASRANLMRLENDIMDKVHGTPEQIDRWRAEGKVKISDQLAEQLKFRHELPFDVRGRPVGAGQRQTGAAKPTQRLRFDDKGELIQ